MEISLDLEEIQMEPPQVLRTGETTNILGFSSHKSSTMTDGKQQRRPSWWQQMWEKFQPLTTNDTEQPVPADVVVSSTVESAPQDTTITTKEEEEGTPQTWHQSLFPKKQKLAHDNLKIE
jgi:hypothetical protein